MNNSKSDIKYRSRNNQYSSFFLLIFILLATVGEIAKDSVL